MDMSQLLKLVAKGQISFSSPSDSKADLSEFQQQVQLIRQAESMGYLRIIKSHIEFETGMDYVDQILVEMTVQRNS
jgi:hypothetical protein